MAFDVASPGQFVVPLSTIIDQLQGKLTSAQIDALVQAIIGGKTDKVAPGDLITADLMNQILGDIQDLEQKVAQLAGGGGPTANTHAVSTLGDTWSAYGALVKNGTLQPDPTSSDAIRTDLTIAAHFQDVMYAALSGLGLAYGAGSAALLGTMQELYDRQHDIVVLFSGTIPGVLDPTPQHQFATNLNIGLEQDPAAGGSSLKKALTASNLNDALDAQDRINETVRNQGGDVTTGNLSASYRGAVGSTETLVIGSTSPVLYNFRVGNGTNRDLDVQLKAEFLPPQQGWNSQVSVVALDGSAISHILLAAFDPSNPTSGDSNKDVRVAVMTPTAVDGDSGTLQFTAFVPPPLNVRATATRKLEVHTTAVTQTPGTVSYSPGSPVLSQDLSTAVEWTPITLAFTFAFAAGTGPTSRSFTFRLDITSPGANTALFDTTFALGSSSLGLDSSNTSTLIRSVPFTMNDGDADTITVTVVPITGASGHSLAFTATVESAADSVKDQSQALTISVQ